MPIRKRRPYDHLALRYDVRAEKRTKAVATFLTERQLVAGARVLDLGVGTGLVWDYMDPKRGPSLVVGVDSSEGMIRQGQQRSCLPRVKFVQAEFENLPFRGLAFDKIVLCFAAHHVRNLTNVLRRAAELLVNRGELLLIEYAGETQMRLAGTVLRCYDLLKDAVSEAPLIPSHFSAGPESELLAVAALAGFQQKSLTYTQLTEASGHAAVMDFVMQSPPLAFSLCRLGKKEYARIRNRLIEGCVHYAPDRIRSKVMICALQKGVLDKPA